MFASGRETAKLQAMNGKIWPSTVYKNTLWIFFVNIHVFNFQNLSILVRDITIDKVNCLASPEYSSI
jgi:hypothetical protein